MSKDEARVIIRSYVRAWEERDKTGILQNLTPDAVIVEAHGVEHRTLEIITPWLEKWLATGSTMDYWHMESLHFDNTTQTAFFTWEFASTYEGKKDTSRGISMVLFKDGKMKEIRGYQELKN